MLGIFSQFFCCSSTSLVKGLLRSISKLKKYEVFLIAEFWTFLSFVHYVEFAGVTWFDFICSELCAVIFLFWWPPCTVWTLLIVKYRSAAPLTLFFPKPSWMFQILYISVWSLLLSASAAGPPLLRFSVPQEHLQTQVHSTCLRLPWSSLPQRLLTVVASEIKSNLPSFCLFCGFRIR